MKIIDILNAKNNIIMLNKVRFADFKIVSSIYRFTKKINEVLEIYQQEQKKLIDAYVIHDEKGNLVTKNNQYQFATDDDKNKYLEELNKLVLSEVPDLNKIDIPLDSIHIAEGFASEDIINLEPLINWI